MTLDPQTGIFISQFIPVQKKRQTSDKYFKGENKQAKTESMLFYKATILRTFFSACHSPFFLTIYSILEAGGYT